MAQHSPECIVNHCPQCGCNIRAVFMALYFAHFKADQPPAAPPQVAIAVGKPALHGKRRVRHLNDNMVAQVNRLINDKVRPSEIARRLNIPVYSVYNAKTKIEKENKLTNHG